MGIGTSLKETRGDVGARLPDRVWREKRVVKENGRSSRLGVELLTVQGPHQKLTGLDTVRPIKTITHSSTGLVKSSTKWGRESRRIWSRETRIVSDMEGTFGTVSKTRLSSDKRTSFFLRDKERRSKRANRSYTGGPDLYPHLHIPDNRLGSDLGRVVKQTSTSPVQEPGMGDCSTITDPNQYFVSWGTPALWHPIKTGKG